MIRRFLLAALLSTAIAALPVSLLAGSNQSAFAQAAISGERPMAERPVPVIRVSGEATASIAPDMAIVTLGILREAPTAREALDAHKKVAGDVAAAMKQMGMQAKDLQTANFSIQPRYVYPAPKATGEQEQPRIVGYAVSSQLVLRIRDISLVGTVLDQAVTLGVNSDGNIAFINDNPAQAIAKARAEAMKDAMARAGTLAEAAGVTLGPVLEISESFSQPQPMPITRGKMLMEASGDAVPVEAGENAYSVSVQAVFEIKQ